MTNSPAANGILLVLDGWGHAAAGPGNALANARTPVLDGIAAQHPSTFVEASGEHVGLLPGTVGNSESLARVEEFFASTGTGVLATVSGRGYGLDKSGDLELTAKVSEAITESKGPTARDYRQVLARAESGDVWIAPTVLTGPDGTPLPCGGHTTNPVPAVVVPAPGQLIGEHLSDGGSLADIAPTVLHLLGRPSGPAMTGRSLL